MHVYILLTQLADLGCGAYTIGYCVQPLLMSLHTGQGDISC